MIIIRRSRAKPVSKRKESKVNERTNERTFEMKEGKKCRNILNLLSNKRCQLFLEKSSFLNDNFSTLFD